MSKPQSITIQTNSIKLLVNDDKNRVIEFDPADIGFIDELYDLISDFDIKEKEYKQKYRVLDANKDVDKYGIPKNTKSKLNLTKELCAYMREKIDLLFGDGTSNAAFGKSNNLDVFTQFFDGITPFIKSARNKKTAKYISDENSGVMQ